MLCAVLLAIRHATLRHDADASGDETASDIIYFTLMPLPPLLTLIA